MARLNFSKTKVSDLKKQANESPEEEVFTDDRPIPQDIETDTPTESTEHSEPTENTEHVETSPVENHSEESKEQEEGVKTDDVEKHKETESESHEANKHEDESPLIDDGGNSFDGVYGEAPMPNDDEIYGLHNIKASELSKIDLENQIIQRQLDENFENILSDFKRLPDNEKRNLISKIVESDSSFGDILKEVYDKNKTDDIEHPVGTMEHVEDYKRKSEELEKRIEDLQKELESSAKERELKDSKLFQNYEEPKEEPERSSPNEEHNIDASSNTYSNGDRLGKMRIPDRNDQNQNEGQQPINNGQFPQGATTVMAQKSRNPFGSRVAGLGSIKDSIARRNHDRAVNNIDECATTTRAYNLDVREYNEQATKFGVVDVINDRTLTDSQRNEKIRDIYKKNPSLSSLEKRIAENGKKISYLHDKISDELGDAANLGHDVSEAENSYKDLLSSNKVEKPIVSSPSMKLQEIAKKIVESIKAAMAKLGNLFVKKEASGPTGTSGPSL